MTHEVINDENIASFLFLEISHLISSKAIWEWNLLRALRPGFPTLLFSFFHVCKVSDDFEWRPWIIFPFDEIYFE